MTQGRENLVQLSLKRANETLEEAQLLAQTQHPLGASNRVYYACFYAVTALLMTRDATSSKHSGLIALFNRHFVKTGIVPVKFGKFYSRLFDQRQESDYAYIPEIDPQQLNEDIQTAAEFIRHIEAILKDNN